MSHFLVFFKNQGSCLRLHQGALELQQDPYGHFLDFFPDDCVLQFDDVICFLIRPLDKRIPELPAGDWESWKAMENMVDSGKILSIGISNWNVGQLRSLILGARIKPEYVQKRCFANTGWEKEIRDLCKQNDIIFQGKNMRVESWILKQFLAPFLFSQSRTRAIRIL